MRKLPLTLIMTAEFDPLRDEGRAYADHLRASGVACAYRCIDGMVHGFISQTHLHWHAREAMREACHWVRPQQPSERATWKTAER